MYFYGVKPIRMIYHNDWEDPTLILKGIKFNYYDLENALYEYYKDEIGASISFKLFIAQNKTLVIEMAEDIVDALTQKQQERSVSAS